MTAFSDKRLHPEIDELSFVLQLLLLQQIGEIGEGAVSRRGFLLASRRWTVVPFRIQMSCVLIFMAVETQQLPVAAVRRIVVVVVILMMDRQLTKFFA